MTNRRQINIDALERANARLGEFLEAYSAVDESHSHHGIYRVTVQGCGVEMVELGLGIAGGGGDGYVI